MEWSEWVFNGISGCVYVYGLSGCVVVSVSVMGLWNSLCECAYGLSGTQMVLHNFSECGMALVGMKYSQ